jgi:hypothetical protein
MFLGTVLASCVFPASDRFIPGLALAFVPLFVGEFTFLLIVSTTSLVVLVVRRDCYQEEDSHQADKNDLGHVELC